jgi:putative transposase
MQYTSRHRRPASRRNPQRHPLKNPKTLFKEPGPPLFTNARTTDKHKQKRTFRFHYDPRDISQIYFYDPDLKQYFPIPYANRSNPAITKWERIEAHRYLVKLGRSKIDERAIIESIKRRRAIETEAAAKGKVARRNVERVADSKRRTKLTLVSSREPATLEVAPQQSSVAPRVRRTFAVDES